MALGGEPHDISALALLRMHDGSPFLGSVQNLQFGKVIEALGDYRHYITQRRQEPKGVINIMDELILCRR